MLDNLLRYASDKHASQPPEPAASNNDHVRTGFLGYSKNCFGIVAGLDAGINAADAERAAREMAASVDHSLSAPRILLQALATSPALRADDVRGFYERASETHTALGYAITVTVPGERRPLMSTSAPWGSELPQLDEISQGYQMRVADSKMPAVSNLIQRDGSYFVTEYVPVLREGQPVTSP